MHVAFVKNMILILQASLVTKTRGHHHNCFDSQRNRVLKILTQVRLHFVQDRYLLLLFIALTCSIYQNLSHWL